MSTNPPQGPPDPWQPPEEGGAVPPPPPGSEVPPAAPPPPPPPPPPGGYPPASGGYPPAPGGGSQPGYPAQPRNSGKAVAVMLLGIGGLVFSCGCFGVVAAIVALVLAPGAKREIRDSGGALTGEGMVKAGVICAWIAVAVGVLIVLLFILGLATSDSTSTSYG